MSYGEPLESNAPRPDELTVIVPDEPPVLTSALARALLRLIVHTDGRSPDAASTSEDKAA